MKSMHDDQIPHEIDAATGLPIGPLLADPAPAKRPERVVLDGFFPAVLNEAPEPRRAGIVSFGLPYERDPAITRHVRQFLAFSSSGPVRG